MVGKTFIGGGFPGIKDCVDHKTILTKESTEKREFSARKIISINQILTNRQINKNDSEKFNLHLKSKPDSDSEEFDSYNLQLINKPLK